MLLKQFERLSNSSLQNTTELGSSGEHRGMILASLVMILVGWGGLAVMVTATRPRIGGEIWLFFILLQLAVTGSAIPVVRVVSQRLAQSEDSLPLTGVIVRRSVWVGIVAVASAWLMIPRYLSLPILLILILLVLVVEVFLRNRELANER